MTGRWLAGLIRRRAGGLVATAAGVAVAVALLWVVGGFIAQSKATMTTRAAAQVPVDWQVQAAAGADPAQVLATVTSQPYVRVALPVGYAPTTGLAATTGGSVQTTGAGVVVGLPPGYAGAFPGEVRLLAGSPDGVLLSQQTAANLRVRPGDVVSLGLAGTAAVPLTVAGVVDLPQADSFFQRVGAPAGSQPTAPPDDVVLVPRDRWLTLVAPLDPATVTSQVHVHTDRHLPTDPSAAYTTVTGEAANLSLRLAGTATVGNNLATTLAAARGDALYAQVLFLFLGAPGAVLAGFLTAVVAGASAGRRRSEQSLLRTRGATLGVLTRLAAAEATVVWLLGVAAGLAAGAAVSAAVFGSTGGLGWAAAAAATGLVVAVGAVLWPAWRSARRITVADSRRELRRRPTPLWARLGLDVWLTAAGAVVWWLSSRNGYQLVLAPDGVASVSVSYWVFAAPLLLWVGGGLLTWRAVNALLRRGGRVLRSILRPLTGGLAPTASSMLGRQSPVVARAAVLVGLTIAFATSTAIFDATYRQQANADARLTNGGDVTVRVPAATGPDLGPTLAGVRGVRAVEPLVHRFAYVGADLQDLYGVRPSTVVGATDLQDAYFSGGTATEMMARLAATPDGVLVSAETVKDFQLSLGDTLRLRLPQAGGGADVTVPFRYVGVVKEFPTAPKDSFLVANATYVTRMAGGHADTWLLGAGDQGPRQVATAVAAVAGPGATVTDIATARTVVGSTLTALDLSGLAGVELGFAIALAAAGTALVLALGLADRRRSFAILSALGARPTQLLALAGAEVAVVAAAGLVAGAVVGGVLAEVLVKVLTGVFDPPPSALAVPWGYEALLGAAAVAAAATAAAVAARLGGRRPLEVLRSL